jgi:hypothetical protein
MANDNYNHPWLIEIPIEPTSRHGRDRLAVLLARLAAEHPAFGISIDPACGPPFVLSLSLSLAEAAKPETIFF